jgi:hypothetical protein
VLNGPDTDALSRHARTEDRSLARGFQHKNQHEEEDDLRRPDREKSGLADAEDHTYDPATGVGKEVMLMGIKSGS